MRRATRALPVDFWMLNFEGIQHRVASLTLEYKTTFTRHHAFLKKAGENFHPVGVARAGAGENSQPGKAKPAAVAAGFLIFMIVSHHLLLFDSPITMLSGLI